MNDLKDELRQAIIGNQEKVAAPGSVSQVIVGKDNIQVNGGIHISKNERKIERTFRAPEPDDINAHQKKFIQDKIHQLADRDVAKGVEIGKARTAWWSRLKKKFYVNSYICLKQSQFDDVMKWLDQQVGMTRSKLRKTDKAGWRKEYYTALNAKRNQLKMPKQWLYDQAFEITGKQVTSLKDLTDVALKKLHQKIFSRHKGVVKRKRI